MLIGLNNIFNNTTWLETMWNWICLHVSEVCPENSQAIISIVGIIITILILMILTLKILSSLNVYTKNEGTTEYIDSADLDEDGKKSNKKVKYERKC